MIICQKGMNKEINIYIILKAIKMAKLLEIFKDIY